MRPAFVSPTPGLTVLWNGRVYKIDRIISRDWVIARDVETKTDEKIRIHELELPLPDETGEGETQDIDISDIPEEDWEVARRRYKAIKPLVEKFDRTRDDALAVAKAAGVHVTTIYDWMKAYQASYHLSSLIPLRRGPKEGSTKISKRTEEIVETAINDFVLSRRKFKPAAVIEEVLERCHVAKVTPPHPNTVRNRIKHLSPALVLRAQGDRDKARDRYEPIRGHFPGADVPLSVVQIDHTEADIVVVEESTRLPMGRPWITVAIDVHTRMVAGVYVSMERPNATATGLCLSRSMLDKSAYLVSLGVEGVWPVVGKMRMVHADNAKEFRGKALARSCEEYGIDVNFRPVKTPHYGAHIERFMGISANRFKQLPGATFSSPSERSNYDSDANSAFTLEEFEAYFVDFIINYYHEKRHGSLGISPIQKWRTSIIGDDDTSMAPPVTLVNDPERVQLDFMPYELRTVQRYGVSMNGIYYYDRVLSPWINAADPKSTKKKRTFTFRYDPRDLSQIYFFEPLSQRYHSIPYRSRHRPAVSLWEIKNARRRLREQQKQNVNEDALFEAILALRGRAEDAIAKTKAARRAAHRVRKTEKRAKKTQRSPEIAPVVDDAMTTASSVPAVPVSADDPFSGPVEIFEHDGG